MEGRHRRYQFDRYLQTDPHPFFGKTFIRCYFVLF